MSRKPSSDIEGFSVPMDAEPTPTAQTKAAPAPKPATQASEIPLPDSWPETCALLARLNEEMPEATEAQERAKNFKLAQLRSHAHRQQQGPATPEMSSEGRMMALRLSRGVSSRHPALVEQVRASIRKTVATR